MLEIFQCHVCSPDLVVHYVEGYDSALLDIARCTTILTFRNCRVGLAENIIAVHGDYPLV